MMASWATGVSAVVVAAAAALVLAAGTTAQVPDFARGEQILSASCQECHERRRIEIQAKDYNSWLETVSAMIDNGAEIENEEVPVLLEYLTVFHGPLPDGVGKDVLLNTCTMCHDLQRIKLGRRSPPEWEETLVTMLNEGAPINDDEFDRVHHYLSTYFGVD